MCFQRMREYRIKNIEHLFVYHMGEGVCQLDNFTRPSWRGKLTYETIPISVCGQ